MAKIIQAEQLLLKRVNHTLVVTDAAGNATTVQFTIDKTASIVSGVLNNGFYNQDDTLSFNETSGLLNGVAIESNYNVSSEGDYTLVVTDLAGNVTTVNFTIDKTAPIVTGVSNNGQYNNNVTVTFNEGTATLNGDVITSDTVVSHEGTYSLIVTDKAGNVTSVKFTIDKTAPKVDKVTSKITKVTGKAEVSSTIVIKAGTKVIGTAKADKYGKFTVSIAKQKAGTILYVTAKDKAGNVSKATKVSVSK